MAQLAGASDDPLDFPHTDRKDVLGCQFQSLQSVISYSKVKRNRSGPKSIGRRKALLDVYVNKSIINEQTDNQHCGRGRFLIKQALMVHQEDLSIHSRFYLYSRVKRYLYSKDSPLAPVQYKSLSIVKTPRISGTFKPMFLNRCLFTAGRQIQTTIQISRLSNRPR